MRSTYRLEPRFFGQTHDIKEISIEYLYALIKHLGLSYYDAYNMPIWRRVWFVDKLINENKEKTARQEMQAKAAQQKSTSNSSKRLFG